MMTVIERQQNNIHYDFNDILHIAWTIKGIQVCAQIQIHDGF